MPFALTGALFITGRTQGFLTPGGANVQQSGRGKWDAPCWAKLELAWFKQMARNRVKAGLGERDSPAMLPLILVLYRWVAGGYRMLTVGAPAQEGPPAAQE